LSDINGLWRYRSLGIFLLQRRGLHPVTVTDLRDALFDSGNGRHNLFPSPLAASARHQRRFRLRFSFIWSSAAPAIDLWMRA
jgi:hypothetical protein